MTGRGGLDGGVRIRGAAHGRASSGLIATSVALSVGPYFQNLPFLRFDTLQCFLEVDVTWTAAGTPCTAADMTWTAAGATWMAAGTTNRCFPRLFFLKPLCLCLPLCLN